MPDAASLVKRLLWFRLIGSCTLLVTSLLQLTTFTWLQVCLIFHFKFKLVAVQITWFGRMEPVDVTGQLLRTCKTVTFNSKFSCWNRRQISGVGFFSSWIQQVFKVGITTFNQLTNKSHFNMQIYIGFATLNTLNELDGRDSLLRYWFLWHRHLINES